MKLRELWGIPIPGTEKAVGLKKVTRDYGKKQARNKKLSTGELDDGTRAWPEGAKVSDILHGKGQKFRESEKLKIERKEAGIQKRAETLRKKKEGTKVSRQEGWDVEEKAIIGGKETTTTIRKERQQQAKELKAILTYPIFSYLLLAYPILSYPILS